MCERDIKRGVGKEKNKKNTKKTNGERDVIEI